MSSPSLPRAVPEPAAEPGLERAIGPFTLGATSVNLAVGAGIFALPAAVALILGPAAVLAYLLCGVLVVMVLACFAEMGSQVTRSGGAVAYVEEAFGPFAGFLTWVTFSLGFSVVADAAIANVMLDTMATFAPALGGGVPRVATLVLLFGLLAAVNVRGVRQGARISIATTVAKLLPLVLVILLGVVAIDWRQLAITEMPTLEQLGQGSLLLFFAFAGMESALTASGEIRDPARTVPRGLLGGVAALVLLYLALQVTAQGVLGPELAAQQEAPLATLAERLAGPMGRTVILGCTVLAVFGALSADMLGAPRALLAAAESGTLPSALARIHPRWRTPWVAIAAFAAATMLLAITGAFRPLAVLGSISLLLVYLAVCLATLQLRRTRPRAPGTFRVPGGPVVPLVAAATVVWVLSHSTRAEVAAMALLLGVGALYYVARTRLGARPPTP